MLMLCTYLGVSVERSLNFVVSIFNLPFVFKTRYEQTFLREFAVYGIYFAALSLLFIPDGYVGNA